MESLINKKERVILLYSNIINSNTEYDELKKLLQKHTKISEKMIYGDKISETTRNLFVSKAYKNLVSEAFDEWYAKKTTVFDNKSEIRCSLCNRENHIICYIKNRHNSIELNVGKDCIKHFPHLTDEYEKSYDVKEKVKEIERIKNFNTEYKNFEMTILYYRNTLLHSPFLVSWSIFYNVDRLINEAKKIQKNYIEGKINKSCLKDICSKINEIDKLIKIDLVKENRELVNNKFACTNELANFIMCSDKKEKDLIIKKIRINNSCIDSETIKYFSYLPFIKQNLKDYKEITSEIFNYINIYESNLYVTIKNRDEYGIIKKHILNDIPFYTTPKKFMEYLGEVIFFKYDKKYASTHKLSDYLNLKYLLSNVFILDDSEDNYIFLLVKRLNRFWGYNYEFLYDSKKGITYIINKHINKMITMYDINVIVRKLLIYFDNYNSLDDANFKDLCNNIFFKKLKWRNISDDDISEINKCREIMDDDIYIDTY